MQTNGYRASRPATESDDGTPLVIVGAEGGAVTLYGRKTPAGWEFRTHLVDQTPCLLDEPEICRFTAWTPDWDVALADLDRQRWFRLTPIRVVPVFRERVWEAIRSRLAAGFTDDPARRDGLLARWRECCEVTE